MSASAQIVNADLRRIVVLISGSGSNLQALINACNTPNLPKANVVLVLSNRKAAYGLERARAAEPPIPTAYLALQPYLKAHPGATREDYDAAVADIVLEARPDIVVLAGWMHVLSDRFLDVLARKTGSGGELSGPAIPVINLHPALPGAFDGTHAIQRAHEAFQRGEITKGGVMVHRVVKEVDRGEPVIVKEVEMREGEDVESYEKRIHTIEWQIIVEATKKALNEVKPLAAP